MVGFILSSAIIKLYATQFAYLPRINLDQDLFALGMATVLGVMCGQAFTPSGSLSRTAIIVNSGGKSQLVSFISGGLVCGVVMFATGVLEFVPYASLAAVVLLAIRSLTKQVRQGITLIVDARRRETRGLDGVGRIWTMKRHQAIVWWVTFTIVLVFGLGTGLGVGIGLCALCVMYDMRPRWIELGLAHGSVGGEMGDDGFGFYRSMYPTGFLTSDPYESWSDVPVYMRVNSYLVTGPLNQIDLPSPTSPNVRIYQYRSALKLQPLQKTVMKLCRNLHQDPDLAVSWVLLDLSHMSMLALTSCPALQREVMSEYGIKLMFIHQDAFRNIDPDCRLFNTIHSAIQHCDETV
jgi:MFS superfamily sulfate permease-like transporter